MIRTIERSSCYEIFSIDMVGRHPDQECEDYFGIQVGELIKQKRSEGLFLKTITSVYASWVIVFDAHK
jgi:hypothetical protein